MEKTYPWLHTGAQDSNPGSLSRESESLATVPLCHCATVPLCHCATVPLLLLDTVELARSLSLTCYLAQTHLSPPPLVSVPPSCGCSRA